MRVDATSYEGASRLVAQWASGGEPRYVCVANVHSTIVGRNEPDFRLLVNAADLVTPDGMPLVWMLRLLGIPNATRVYGPTLTLHVCEEAARVGIPVGFYGATEDVIEALSERLRERFPALVVAYAHAPPFRALSDDEDAAIVRDIVASKAQILFVGLGCPKQERWMQEHRSRLPVVQIGVGAAFDFHAGHVRQAPLWVQQSGFEWLFRLLMEPGRLWRRYLTTNPRFMLLAALQLLRVRRFDS